MASKQEAAVRAEARGHDIGRRSPHVLLRRVEGEQGTVRLRTVCAPRMEYGLTDPICNRCRVDTGARGRKVLRQIVASSPQATQVDHAGHASGRGRCVEAARGLAVVAGGRVRWSV